MPTIDNTTAVTSTTHITPVTFSHTVFSNTDGYLSLRINTARSGRSVGSATYNGVALTELIQAAQGVANTALFELKAPPVGTFDVVVNFIDGGGSPSGCNYTIGATSYTGVDQTTPTGTPVSAISTVNGMLATVDVTSATGELVCDIVSFGGSGTDIAGVGQTERFNLQNSGNGVQGSGSDEAGAATTTMSWTNTINRAWSICAVALKPAPTGPIITINSSRQSQAISSPAITQHSVLGLAALAQPQALDSMLLSVAGQVDIVATSQSQTLSSLGLTQRSAVSIVNTLQPQAVDLLVLSQHHAITVNELSQPQRLSVMQFTQHGAVSIADTNQPQVLDSVALSVAGQLNISAARQNQALDVLTVNQHSNITVSDVSQLQTIDAADIVQVHQLSVNALAQSQSIDQPAITHRGLMVLADVNQTQSIGPVVLTQHGVLVVNDLAQLQRLQSMGMGEVIGWLDGALVVVSALDGALVVVSALDGALVIKSALDGTIIIN